MNYPDAIEFLYGLRLFGTKFGLENTFALAALCGNPQQKLRFIHVAGTNGKGSVCAMLENIYRLAGLRVGLFTSPHLVSFTERIQVNRRCISEEQVSALVEDLQTRLGVDRESWPFRPTFFEFVTVMALQHFARESCDLVIWETGMGGRLDATNVVRPLASIITNIQLDHQQWLGNTLAEIAAEKAGIIKAGAPVITGAGGEALEVIRQAASRTGSECIVVNAPVERMEVSLPGEHQRQNAAIVVATVNALQAHIPVSAGVIREGLASTSWPGRQQWIRHGNSNVLLDGAHNPDGARTLAGALNSDGITLVLGLFKDKAWQDMCEILVPRTARVFLAPLQNERSADLALVSEFCRQRWPLIPVEACASTSAALRAALHYPTVVIAGSLHLVGEALQELGFSQGRSERELNEWDASRKQP